MNEIILLLNRIYFRKELIIRCSGCLTPHNEHIEKHTYEIKTIMSKHNIKHADVLEALKDKYDKQKLISLILNFLEQ